MKASGRMTRLQEKESIRTLMELITMVNGSMTSNMVTGRKAGQTVQSTQASTLKGRNTAKGCSNGRTGLTMMGSLKTTTFMGRASTTGQTEEDLRVTG